MFLFHFLPLAELGLTTLDAGFYCKDGCHCEGHHGGIESLNSVETVFTVKYMCVSHAFNVVHLFKFFPTRQVVSRL